MVTDYFRALINYGLDNKESYFVNARKKGWLERQGPFTLMNYSYASHLRETINRLDEQRSGLASNNNTNNSIKNITKSNQQIFYKNHLVDEEDNPIPATNMIKSNINL